ncbi:hypothetical protein [Pontimicrobium sp. MEBiC01747]|jgi:hypothetical protein
MKKLILLFISILSLSSFTTNKTTMDIVGKWVGEEKGDIGYFIFDKEGYATLEAQGQVLGGKEFVMKGKKGSMTYQVNYEATPVEIDLIVTMLETKEQKKMLFIAKAIDDNTIQLASSFSTTRPTEFNDVNSIILTRVKE